MAYDDEQSKSSRVVVDTPTSRREVTHTEAVRNDRNGMSGATVGVIVVVAIAVITILVLLLMNQQQNANTNANLAAQEAAQQQQPIVVQQPAPQQQPPVIIQQPAATTQQPPVIINQPATSGDTGNTSNDGAVQMAVDKKVSDDPILSALGITATVLDGKVTLTGTVKSEALKSQVDKAVRSVKGVKQVDNQLSVMS
jgi:osmotically-inducible protein OsmY